MIDSFEIRLQQWLAREYGSPLDQATLAEMSVWVDDFNLMKLDDGLAKTVRYAARLSVHRLAHWLAGNWWRLRWEPESDGNSRDWTLSHNMAAAGGGYLWPNLTFSSDGDYILVRATPTPDKSIESVRYLIDFGGQITAETFEYGIDALFDQLFARLAALNIDDPQLRAIWGEVRAERADAEMYRLRKLEAVLGYDPDEAPKKLLEALGQEAQVFGEASVEEVAAASKQEQALRDLEDVQHRQDAASGFMIVRNLGELRDNLLSPKGPELPWQKGERLARAARNMWSLEQGPLSDKQLCGVLNVSSEWLETAPTQGLPFSAGFRKEDQPEAFRVLLRPARPTGRRFHVARLIADQLIAGSKDRLLPVTTARTSRQKLQRSFASELLCPYTELMEVLGTSCPDADQIERAADYFNVSPLLVQTVLVNKRCLPRESLTY